MQMASLSIELCAYSVAIALVCRPRPTTIRQWSIDSLCEQLKSFEHIANHNFRFDDLALHQGLTIFKKTIEQYGCTIVPVHSKGINMMQEFMDLPAKCRGADIIFKTDTPSAEMTMGYLVQEIYRTVNVLLSRTYKVESQYVSVSQIYGVMWLEQMSDVGVASEQSHKRRKKGEDIGYKQMNRYGKKVCEFISNTICAVDESPTRYIDAAAKESADRSSGGLEAIRRNIFERDEDDTDLQTSQVTSYPAVKLTLSRFPNKNVTFKLHEVQMVIALFDSVAEAQIQLEGTKYQIDSHRTATFTKEILSRYTRYSELVADSIVRWVARKDVVRKTSGRKVSIQFEADVWCKLMICEFEQKMVRCTVLIL